LLAQQVDSDDYRMGTGFLGTPVICDALTAAGQLDTAYALLMQRGCPSWLYPVTMGATTIWERWNSMLPDGSINPGQMTSFNHYALGAVADWIHRTVAGLAPAAAGYRAGCASAPAPAAFLPRRRPVSRRRTGRLRSLGRITATRSPWNSPSRRILMPRSPYPTAARRSRSVRGTTPSPAPFPRPGRSRDDPSVGSAKAHRDG
jgi:Bacterial alpha-L-rhamnosidase 6 hairpin glycosidase domain